MFLDLLLYLVTCLQDIHIFHLEPLCVIMQGNSRGYLYHDDFHSFDYQQGEYVLCEITMHSGTTLTVRQVQYIFHVFSHHFHGKYNRMMMMMHHQHRCDMQGHVVKTSAYFRQLSIV